MRLCSKATPCPLCRCCAAPLSHPLFVARRWRRTGHWALLLFVTAAIQPYLLLMVTGVLAGDVLRQVLVAPAPGRRPEKRAIRDGGWPCVRNPETTGIRTQNGMSSSMSSKPEEDFAGAGAGRAAGARGAAAGARA